MAQNMMATMSGMAIAGGGGANGSDHTVTHDKEETVEA